MNHPSLKAVLSGLIIGLMAVFPGAAQASTNYEYPEGTRYIFNPGAAVPGLNVGQHAGNPSGLTNGDLWYNSSTNQLIARINGSNVALGSGGGGGGSGDALTTDPLSQFAATTSAQLAGVISDENGTGKLIFSAGTLAVTSGKTLSASNSLTLTGTDGSSVAFGTGGTVLYSSGLGSTIQAYDGDLASIAALTTAAYGRSLLTAADASAGRGLLSLGGMATQDPGAVSISGGNITNIASLTATNSGDDAFTISGTATGSGGTGVYGLNSTGAGFGVWGETSVGGGVGVLASGNHALAIPLRIGNVGGVNVDVTSAVTANKTLAITDSAVSFDGSPLLRATNNLSDVANAGLALANLTGEVAPNTVFAGPDGGGNDNPSFVTLTTSYLPMVAINNAITGNTSLTTLGTVTTGTWSADTIAVNKGGTGQTTAQGAINALMAASGALSQGDIFYYNGTNVVRLAAGTSGYFLKTQGAGANPTWAAMSGGGSLSDGDYGDVTVSASGATWTVDDDITKTWTGTHTWGSGLAQMTSPRITTCIFDTNGNKAIGLTATSSALFGLEITNAASGGTVALGTTAPAQASASVAGTPLTIQASDATVGSASGTAIGGPVTIKGGKAAAFSAAAIGGLVTLQGGDSSDGTSDGAFITLGGGRSGAVNIKGGVTNNGRVTIATADNSANTTIPKILIQPGRPSASNSANASGAVEITTQTGGNTTGASTNAGASGAIALTVGSGGAGSGNTAVTGGAGGDFTVTGGTGGNATGAGGTHTGGTGTTLTFTSGAGGNATGASGTRTGGPSGDIQFKIGAAGTGATANGVLGVFKVEAPSGTEMFRVSSTAGISVPKTITASGTTGAQTIDKTSGRVNFAAAATSLVVTNSLVTANSVIIATVASNDATMKSVAVVAGSGSFTIYANAAATGETAVNFLITN